MLSLGRHALRGLSASPRHVVFFDALELEHTNLPQARSINGYQKLSLYSLGFSMRLETWKVSFWHILEVRRTPAIARRADLHGAHSTSYFEDHNLPTRWPAIRSRIDL